MTAAAIIAFGSDWPSSLLVGLVVLWGGEFRVQANRRITAAEGELAQSERRVSELEERLDAHFHHIDQQTRPE